MPILVYHDLGTPPASEPYPGLYVSDADFEAEMAWLDQQGYQAVTLDEVMSAWYHGGTLPSKPIVITFDNGYIPQATFAPAVLSSYGWPGVLNEITAGHLTTRASRNLLSLGWEIDSHSVTHPDLTAISPSALQYQVVASRTLPAEHLPHPGQQLLLPVEQVQRRRGRRRQGGRLHERDDRERGYATSADPFLLDRFEIEGGQGVAGLAADLREG